MKYLSSRQREILVKIADYLKDGVPPSAARLAAEFGLAGESSVTPILKALEKKGYLQIEAGVKGRQRTLRLTPKAKQAIGPNGVPLLGNIAAGPLHEAIETAECWVVSLCDVLPHKPGDFLLRVRGDSMIGDGILDGDLVLIRPGVQANNGEIAAVAVGDDHDVTLKHVQLDREQGVLHLVASNPDYATLSFPAGQVEILGVFRGLIRP